MGWAEMVNSGKKQPGERHQPLVLQEVELISGEVDALEGGWSSVSAVRVYGKNYLVPAAQAT